jgi:hypothetical protein
MSSLAKWQRSDDGEYLQNDSPLYAFDVVRLCNRHMPQARAWHELINAAPELLAACEAALTEYEGNDCDPEFSPAMTSLRAAIARARGTGVQS